MLGCVLAVVLLPLCTATGGRAHASAVADSLEVNRSPRETFATDDPAFRTFIPDSLYERRAVKRQKVGTRFCATFRNSTPSVISGVSITFKYPVVMVEYAPFPDASGSEDGTVWHVYGQNIAPGDSVQLCGIVYRRDFVPILEWHFTGLFPSQSQPGFIPEPGGIVLPMPNGANFREEVFVYGGFGPGTSQSDSAGGMVIGQSFMFFDGVKWRVDRDSARVFGWVRHRRSSDLRNSLRPGRGGITHIGIPRGFCTLDNGRPFVGQKYSLSAAKMNNRLFAQLAALKMNIAASTLGVTPPGFGELVLAQEGHPLNGRSIKQIARMADSIMTRCSGRPLQEYAMMDSLLLRINLAFVGPIDTIAFGSGLRLTGVRPISQVQFLRPGGEPPTVIEPRYNPEFADDEEEAGNDDRQPSIISVVSNYPNPFNPLTTLYVDLVDDAVVTLQVFNVLGQEVAALAREEVLPYGPNEIEFDASRLPSGVYFTRVVARDVRDRSVVSQSIHKMMLVK